MSRSMLPPPEAAGDGDGGQTTGDSGTPASALSPPPVAVNAPSCRMAQNTASSTIGSPPHLPPALPSGVSDQLPVGSPSPLSYADQPTGSPPPSTSKTRTKIVRGGIESNSRTKGRRRGDRGTSPGRGGAGRGSRREEDVLMDPPHNAPLGLQHQQYPSQHPLSLPAAGRRGRPSSDDSTGLASGGGTGGASLTPSSPDSLPRPHPGDTGTTSHPTRSQPPPLSPALPSQWPTPNKATLASGCERLLQILEKARSSLARLVGLASSAEVDLSMPPETATSMKQILSALSCVRDTAKRNEMCSSSNAFSEAKELVRLCAKINLMGGSLENVLKLPSLLSTEWDKIDKQCSTLQSELVNYGQNFGLKHRDQGWVSNDTDPTKQEAFDLIKSMVGSIQAKLQNFQPHCTKLSETLHKEVEISRSKIHNAKHSGATSESLRNEKQTKITTFILPPAQPSQGRSSKQQSRAMSDTKTKSAVAVPPVLGPHPALFPRPSHDTEEPLQDATMEQHCSLLSSSSQVLPLSSQRPLHIQSSSSLQLPSDEEARIRKMSKSRRKHVMSTICKKLPTSTTGAFPPADVTSSHQEIGKDAQTTGITSTMQIEQDRSHLEQNLESNLNLLAASAGEGPKKTRSLAEKKSRRTVSRERSKGKKRKAPDGATTGKDGKRAGAGRKKVSREICRAGNSSSNSKSNMALPAAPLDHSVTAEDITVTVAAGRGEEKDNFSSHVLGANTAEKRSSNKIRRDNRHAVDRPTGKKVKRDNRRVGEEKSSGKKATKNRCDMIVGDASGEPLSRPNGLQNSGNGEEQEAAIGDADEEKCGNAGTAAASTDNKEKKKEIEIRIEDQYPLRITNPLLELPPYPQLPRGAAPSSLPVELIPQGAELWNTCEVYFPRPDTYPISYLARLLGFEVPSIKPSSNRDEGCDESLSTSKFDPKILPLTSKSGESRSSTSDPWLSIPPLGNFAENVWKRGRRYKRARPVATSSSGCKGFSQPMGMGDSDDEALDFVDPMWRTIMLNYRGYDDEYFNLAPATSFGQSPKRPPGEECISFARERGILEDGVNFRFAQMGDEDFLSSMNKKSRYLKSKDDYTMALRSPSHFFVVAESENGLPLGLIHYSFNWYKLRGPGLRRTESSDSSRRVSEMIIFIGDMQCSELCSRDVCDNATGGGKAPVSNGKDCRESSGKDQAHIFSSGEAEDTSTERAVVTGTGEEKEKNGIKENLKKTTGDTSTQHIRNCDTKLNEHTTTCKTSLSIILTSLALEHARRCNIWYGMLEVEPSSVPFFKRYFRMTVVPRPPSFSVEDDDGLAPLIPIVCDLKKCGYRYAILSKQEDDENTTSCQATTVATNSSVAQRRLLIRMPNVGEATPFFRASEPNSSHAERDNCKRKKRNCLIYSNPKEEVQSKIIRVRLDVRNSNWTPIDKTAEMKLSILGDSAVANKTLLEGIPREPSLDDPRWEVLRSFPVGLATEVCNSKQICDGSPGATASQTGVGTLLGELEKKQRELMDLESGLEPHVRSLLCRAFDERVQFESKDAVEKRRVNTLTLKDYDSVLERRREADLAWQAQLEQDMDAVCDICGDGEVTVDNQILFCEACNVAVHQKCYGIDSVPAGDYFCQACRFFNRDKMTAKPSRHFEGEAVPPKLTPSPLPISCELCPRKQGAFVRTAFEPKRSKKKKDNTAAKWVHVVCAKWQGLRYIDQEKKDVIEDVTEMKGLYRANKLKCSICEGLRGAVNCCRVPGCKKYMHVTCARACGLCTVRHGENHAGLLETENAWTLCCIEHSNIAPEDVPEGSVTVEQLVTAAKAFPPEPLPEPPKPEPKPFDKMNGRERKEFLSDPEFEEEFIQKIRSDLVGASCAICDTREEAEINHPTYPNSLVKCANCSVIFHRRCLDASASVCNTSKEDILCDSCKYVIEHEDKEDFETPQCHMCNQKGGVLKKAFAKPVSMKKWQHKQQAYKKSLFGRQIWCHVVCGMWHPKCKYVCPENGAVDCSTIIMANGQSHIDSKKVCSLCGRSDKIKIHCSHPGCTDPRYPTNVSFRYHYTCARQAGLEVSDKEGENGEVIFQSKCFHHVKSDLVFRARLEDFIEPERMRAGNELKSVNSPMKYSHAAKLLHHGVTVLRVLGWAWVWAEWWVERGDSWEPLLEEGQKEEDMTREELGYVDSTPESRCADARKCRLAAVGAALRNRDYDEEEDGGRVALDRALRAILHTPSLVGRLKKAEIDFFADWMGRAYRSMSPLLGFGDDKIPVSDSGHCVHIEDGSPKYKLGSRPLPGKQELPRGIFFESGIEEPDDFLRFVAAAAEEKVPRKTKKPRRLERKIDYPSEESDM